MTNGDIPKPTHSSENEQGADGPAPSMESRSTAEQNVASSSPSEGERGDHPAAAESTSAAGDSPNPGAEPARSSHDDSDAASKSSAPDKASRPGERKAGKLARGAGPLAARGLGVAKPSSPAAAESSSADRSTKAAGEASSAGRGKGERKHQSKGKQYPRPRLAGEKADSGAGEPAATPAKPKPARVDKPNLRQELSDDLLREFEAELSSADVESILSGSAGMAERAQPLDEGARVHGKVIKIHGDSVFVGLGGPDEGVVPLEQFTEEEPSGGQQIEVIVRGLNREDGLYGLTLPGQAIEVDDWSDLEEGSVVEATVTGSNTGGLECKVGSIPAFMPISQITEYRVEETEEFVGQKFVCLVTEANERRGNLVLSRRAILEREREEKRKEQLEVIQPGDTLEGTVRSVKDFGAFVDLGGLDGLIHVSKLSWERIKHPNEVIKEGQKVKVKVDTVDKQSGKIGLSYRDLLENPWDTADSEFTVGTVHRGTVTRTATFGCFVRLAAGIEGLVHVSEIAHHRVSRVDAFVSEGDEVDVKVLSFDRDAQKIGLSIKAAQSKAVDVAAENRQQEEDDQPPREPAVKPSRSGPLRGGNNRETGGERFGLRW